MENTDTPIQNQESTPVVESVTEETPTTTTVETTPLVNGEPTTTEETPVTTENENTIEDEIVPPSLPTPTTTTTEEEITQPTDEQENVTDTNTTVPPTSLSPGRVNIPLKEVNESEKEEAAVITNGTNGTENGISKKRELEPEDEQPEETTNDNDERTGCDPIKKIKTSEVTDTPIMDTIEPENNILVNGNTAVEV